MEKVIDESAIDAAATSAAASDAAAAKLAAAGVIELPHEAKPHVAGTLRMAGTVNDSIVDGPGFRFTLFVQGCTHACPNCQNPRTHDASGGHDMTLDEIWGRISSNPLLSGVTFSGGEPMLQPRLLTELANRCHKAGLTVWTYSGYTYEEIAAGIPSAAAQELLHASDVLVDGIFVEARASMAAKWRGSDNQRVIDVRATQEAGEIVELYPVES